MVEVVALHTIHRLLEKGRNDTAGKIVQPAKIEVVEPGTFLHLAEDEVAELMKSESVRVATDDDRHAASKFGRVDVSYPVGEVSGVRR